MKYLVKNGTLLEKSINMHDLMLMYETGCEIMDAYPPTGKEWNGVAWVNTEQAQAIEDVAVLKDMREEAKKKVNLLCYTKIVSGFTSDALQEGEIYMYQSEPVDQANLQGIVTFALTIPANDTTTTVDFRCKRVSDGSDAFRPHTRAQILNIFSDGKDRLLSLLKRAKNLKEAIDLAPTAEEVDFINIEDGW